MVLAYECMYSADRTDFDLQAAREGFNALRPVWCRFDFPHIFLFTRRQNLRRSELL